MANWRIHQRMRLPLFNTMFAQDGVLMYIPKNTILERPIQLVNILRADVDFMVNRRLLIVVEDGAQARLLICDHAMDEVNFLSTQVIEAYVGENAVFDLYELEETHNSTVRFSNLYVDQQANSNVLLNGMTLHNGTTRNTTEVYLSGRGAEVNLCGMAIADRNEQVDNHTFIDHRVSDCTSNELFKYVLDDQPSERLPVRYWYAKEPSILLLSRRTAISVLPVRHVCTPSRSWRFMPTMSSVHTEQP